MQKKFFEKTREFTVIIEGDKEGYYLANVLELRGCHTQAKSLDVLLKRTREAITLCMEVEGSNNQPSEFIGVQRIAL